VIGLTKRCRKINVGPFSLEKLLACIGDVKLKSHIYLGDLTPWKDNYQRITLTEFAPKPGMGPD